MPNICVSELVSIGYDNGSSSIRHQAISRTNAGVLSIGLMGTNFSEIRIGILLFSFRKMHLKLLYAKMAAISYRGWVKGKPWNPNFMFADYFDWYGAVCQDCGALSSWRNVHLWAYHLHNLMTIGMQSCSQMLYTKNAPSHGQNQTSNATMPLTCQYPYIPQQFYSNWD